MASPMTSARLERGSPDEARVRDEEIELEGVEPQQEAPKLIISPVFIFPCPQHPLNPCEDELQLCNEGDGRIKIVVGEEPNETTFLVHKPLLCRFSLYFEGALRDRGSASGRPGTIEAATGEFYWPEDDVDEVHRWIRWLYSCPDCKRCPPYDPSHTCKRPIRRPPRQPSETSPRKSREEHRDARGDAAEDTLTSPWCAAEAERAYVFGDRVLSEQYCVVALASFVQHTHFVDPARFVRVCDSVACNAPLRKFVDHWVLWRKFLERGDAAWGPARGSSLINMHEELFGSREGWTSLDPRKFELPHWWQGCARDPNMLCQHRISFGGLYGGAPMVPGGPFAGRVPPSESKKAMQWVCRLSVLAWFFSNATLLVLAPLVLAGDHQGLVMLPAKACSVVVTYLAFISIFVWAVVGWKWFTMFLPALLGFANAVWATQQTARCFQCLMSTMASVATKARRVLEPAYVRSLFVRVSPIPRSLSERRSVLRALQKYGEIEVFKGLKDPASFISVAAQASTVERLVQNSPLQFDMTPEAPAADPADIASTTSGLASEIALRKALQLSSDPSSLPGSSLEQDVGQELPGLADTATSSSTRGSPAATTFTLHIFPTQNYKHSTTIRYSPLHGPWPTATTGGGDNDDTRPQSFVTAALRLVVPKDMSARGLFDWETGGQAERGGGEYHEIGKREHIRERIERRKLRARAKAGGLLAARKGADGDTETDGPQQVADREKPAGG